MKLVYICSHCKGNIERNIAKARGYSLFAIKQDCIPIAPHIFYTPILDDTIEEQRRTGMVMGLELLTLCQELWVFGDKNTKGMMAEIDAAERLGIPVLFYNDGCERRGE